MNADANETNPQNAQDARNQFLDTVLRVADSPDGRVIFAWLYATTGIRKPAHTIGGNSNDTLYRDGRRSIGLEIQDTIDAARSERASTKPSATGRKTAARSRAGKQKP